MKNLSLVCLAALLCMFSVNAADKHLFILSGQSNMAGLKPEISFTPTVEAAFGKENVTTGASNDIKVATDLAQLELGATQRELEAPRGFADADARSDTAEDGCVEVWFVVSEVGSKGLSRKRPSADLAAISLNGVWSAGRFESAESKVETGLPPTPIGACSSPATPPNAGACQAPRKP